MWLCKTFWAYSRNVFFGLNFCYSVIRVILCLDPIATFVGFREIVYYSKALCVWGSQAPLAKVQNKRPRCRLNGTWRGRLSDCCLSNCTVRKLCLTCRRVQVSVPSVWIPKAHFQFAVLPGPIGSLSGMFLPWRILQRHSWVVERLNQHRLYLMEPWIWGLSPYGLPLGFHCGSPPTPSWKWFLDTTSADPSLKSFSKLSANPIQQNKKKLYGAGRWRCR